MSEGRDLWDQNQHGFWCGCCGYLVARPDADEDALPEQCRQCGYPDGQQVANYHGFDGDDDDASEFEFDCPMGPDGYCPLAGTEECDWDCPHP